MKPDQPEKEIDILAEVRRVRHEISARFGHDPKKLCEHYMELQKNSDRLVFSSPEELDQYYAEQLKAKLHNPEDSATPVIQQH